MKRNKKIKKMSMSIEQKPFNIPYINFKDLEDLNEIITRLKNHYIKIIFRALKDVSADIPQICVMLFKSHDYRFDPNLINAVFLTHFVNPTNPNDQVVMSIQKEPFVINFTQKDSVIPLKLSFLEKNINNAVMLTFTERKKVIDVEILSFFGENRPVFDYFRDVRFFKNFNPLDNGYIPYVFSAQNPEFKIVQDL